LLRSRVGAVLLSASLFAAYHTYQSIGGVAHQMEFGVAYGVAFLLLRRVWPLAVGHALCNIRLGLGV
jgi:membrane protease YdiL (CAAX protease family)